MNRFQLFTTYRNTLTLQIENLACDHPAGTSRRLCKRCDDSYEPIRRKLSRTRQNFEGERQEGIPGKNCDSLIEFFVTRRSATSKIIIVHGWKIVMNQGVAVNHLDGCGHTQYRFPILFVRCECRDTKSRPDPLAAVHRAVPHGVMDSFRAFIGGWK